MNMNRPREHRHGLLKVAALTLPLLVVLGCSSASSGHAPGVAGGESLTPGVTNYPLAYIKRPAPPGTPTAKMPDINVQDLITSTTGGDLYVRDETNAAGAETNVTSSITMGMGDVRDLDVSPDGTKIVFSLRLPLNPNKPNDDVTQPNWHIYQYDAVAKTVTQLTNDDITSGHDVGGHYLPDGRIIFTSTRQLATQSILLDEGRPQYQAQTDNRLQSIFLLHVMNNDGTQMHQISFNTNHDFAPSVLNDGHIVFSRWEVTNGTDQISLYEAYPDGTELSLYYGANSHATGANIAGTNTNIIQFLNARQRPDGTLLAIVRPFLGTQLGGDIVSINAANFVEINQPATPNGPAGTGQSSATTLGVTTDANLPSMGGRFRSAYPLYDGTNRMLVSWSPCLVLNITVTPNTTEVCTAANTTGANVQLAPPQYTLWVYDFDAGTLSPVLSADPGMEIAEPVILQARLPAPTNRPDAAPTTTAAQNMAANGVGLLDISSVYDFDGLDTAKPDIAAQANPSQASFYQRPYRFIRIEKAVEIPSKKVRKIDDADFGPAGMGMREILGYAPIQPDGSVQIQVPANVPFTVDIVDVNARRVTAQHSSWLQLLPGETKSCNGCHSTAKMTSHGRPGLTVAVNPGAPTAGKQFPGTNPTLLAEAKETMAQTLSRLSAAACAKLTATSATCPQLLNSDVIYDDIWTAGVTLPAGDLDAPFSYTYADASPVAPTNANCVPWTAQCRSTIHYAATLAGVATPEIYIQSLWNLPTRTATVNGVQNTPVVCVTCHNPFNANNAPQLPSDSLDLTDDASAADATIINSYEQLLFPRDEQSLNMGILVNTVPEPGPPAPVTGLPTTIQATVTLGSPMAAGSAAGSTGFVGVFGAGGGHFGYLTPAELRLISEWLDIGGQYYNDPFVAPVAN
jgi:Hydrazine synthase alpha subunit middle domain